MGSRGADDAPRSRRVVRIELTARAVLSAILAVAAVYFALRLGTVLVVIVVALVLASTLGPIVGVIERRGVRRPFAVGAVAIATLAVVALLFALTIPALFDAVAKLVARAPSLQATAVATLSKHELTVPLARAIDTGAGSTFLVNALGSVLAYSPRLLELVIYALTTIFLAFYLLLDRDRVRAAAYALLPKPYHLRFARVVRELHVIVGGYVRGQVITSAMMGAVVFVLLLACRVRNPLPFALFAGLADVLPYVGPILVVVPSVLAALPRGVVAALVVLAVLLVYSEIESRVIIPRVYGSALRLPSSAVVIALLVGGALMGIVGALLALPIAAGIRMLVEQLRVELPGDDTDATELRIQDERAERVYEAMSRGAPADVAARVAERIAEQVERAPTESDKPKPVTGGTRKR